MEMISSGGIRSFVPSPFKTPSISKKITFIGTADDHVVASLLRTHQHRRLSTYNAGPALHTTRTNFYTTPASKSCGSSDRSRPSRARQKLSETAPTKRTQRPRQDGQASAEYTGSAIPLALSLLISATIFASRRSENANDFFACPSEKIPSESS